MRYKPRDIYIYIYIYIWTDSVRLSDDGSACPEAERLHTDAAAPFLHTTQASIVRKDGRSNVSALLLPPLSRGSFRDEGTQACLPQWYVHEADAVFYAVVRGSECRHGAGEKKEEWWGPAAVRWREKTGEKGDRFR